jgi:NAD(P)-dependent dehydrogenase (short-subunit alcohol dehydrogenase family)
MTARTIVITGASDGIGAAAARRLVAAGENVVLVGRSEAKTAAVAGPLGAPYHLADFTRLDEVRALGAELSERYERIDVLANNAGGLMGDREMTVDGFEKTLQVNHLAPFLLTHLLLDTLVASHASVLNTSSIGARIFGHLDLDDLDNAARYTPTKAYGDGKLANILFTTELHRRHHAQGISTAAFHPGNVATNFAAGSTSLMRFVYRTPLKHLALISPEKGSDNLVWLATSTPGTDWESGAYYEKRAVTKTNPQAADADLAAGFWDASARMVGLVTT